MNDTPPPFAYKDNNDTAPQAIRQLIADAQAAANNERALLAALATVVGASLKSMSIWGVAALSLALIGLLSLALAGVVALNIWLANPWAGFLVPAALFALAIVAAMVVRSHGKTLRRALNAWRQK